MILSGLKPDHYTFSMLIDANLKIKNHTKALKYFNEMIQFNIHPNQITFISLISGFAKAQSTNSLPFFAPILWPSLG